MNITTANVSAQRLPTRFVTTPELMDEVEEGLNLLQKHREILLQQAESLFETPSRSSGCLSELSVVECVHDSADYQTALKELGELFKASSDFIFALEQKNVHVELKIECYEDSTSSESVIEAFTAETSTLSDDELESFGYFGWISN
jgi:hypothetical protein